MYLCTNLVFVNHKPALNYSEEDLLKALNDVFVPGESEEERKARSNGDQVTREQLSTLLKLHGESFTEKELTAAFGELLKPSKKYKGMLPEKFTKTEFIEDILGLEQQ